MDEAIKLLDLGPNESINKIWESFLIKDKDKLKTLMNSLYNEALDMEIQ